MEPELQRVSTPLSNLHQKPVGLDSPVARKEKVAVFV
jgi:hypothetical protein